MKKQLLVGTALFAAISAFPQTGRNKVKPSSVANIAEITAARFAAAEASESIKATTNSKSVSGPVVNSSAGAEDARSESSAMLPPSTISWNLLCGSMNILGMLVPQSQPLQYNDNVGVVSFIHRKSASYTTSPATPAAAASGVIVAEISSNWGNTWDSTAIWTDANNWGRYPQGGVYTGVGNTLANSYVVGIGPTTPPTAGWTGNFAASKQLNTFNNSPSTAPNAMQMLYSNLASYPANIGPSAFSRNGFSATDDGAMRSLGWIMDDNSALTGMRGVSVVKGTFNAGTFVWTSDSLVPNTVLKTDGSKVFGTAMSPQMAWNESGTVGYVAVMGAAAGSTSCNLNAFQPIIYKTTNSGTSWTQLPGIDFNSAALNPLTDHIASLNTNTNVAVPMFTQMDMVVDAANKLHLGGMFMTGASSHVDSLSFFAQYTVSINPGDEYRWAHVPGQVPYIYDFIGDGSAPWNAITVDSAATEQAGVSAGDAGVNENPWAATGSGGSKTDDVDHRLQMGRTPDGQFITFTWSESDTNFTNGARKYNSLPNVKARCMAVSAGTVAYQISPTEINVTKVAPGTGTANANVANRGTLHYLSPTTGVAAPTSTSSPQPGSMIDIQTPLTVTNSNPFDPVVNNSTYYQRGKLSYYFPGMITGIASNALNSASNSMIYPNPASNNAVLAIELKENSNVDVVVLNTIGQVVKTNKAQGQIGENNINIDLAGLSAGVYMVNVKVGNVTSTKKLIVQ